MATRRPLVVSLFFYGLVAAYLAVKKCAIRSEATRPACDAKRSR